MSRKPNKKLIGFGVFVALAAIGQFAQMAAGGTEGPAATERPRLDRAAEASPPTQPPSGEPAGKPAPTAAPEPTAEQLAIDEAYFKASKRDPAADNYKRVARRRKVAAEDVLEAVSIAAECRAELLAEAKRSVGGVVGDLELKEVARTELGAHTAIVSFTAIRCPEGDPRRDKQLEVLVTSALKKLATNLPAPIDSYRAALWYRGLSCDRGSVGYGASWTRSGGIELK